MRVTPKMLKARAPHHRLPAHPHRGWRLRSAVLLAAGLLLSLMMTSALAEEASSDADPHLNANDVAVEAQQVVEAHCVGMGTDRTAVKASALGAIGPAYARVSEVYERTHVSWLLYWRGVLGQCLGQLDSAEVDLFTFATKRRDDSSMTSLVRDAQRRLAILKRQRNRGTSARESALSSGQGLGVALGAGLAAGAALGAVGTALESAAQQRARQGLYDGDQPTAALDDFVAEGKAAAQRQSAALGISLGLGVGSALAFVLAALPAKNSRTARLAPGPTPLGLGFERRW